MGKPEEWGIILSRVEIREEIPVVPD